MSEAAVTQRGTRAPGDDHAFAPAGWPAPDARRRLQLALGALWLLDAILQYQPVMFTRAFSQMLAAAAEGNPAFVSRPILWDAHLVGQHPVALNTTFATIQLLLALGIAWRPTVRPALGASVVWAVAVWWLGEGLGGVLTGTASPVSGAPGPVILYALLAVLLWPRDRGRRAPGSAGPAVPFVAARAVGAPAARALWLVLWASLAYFALLPANRAPQALHAMLTGVTEGEPAWLASISAHGAAFLAHHGLAASLVLAVLLALIAIGVCLPPSAARPTLAVAAVLAAAIWVAGQDLGGILTGSGTDPGSGPLLILLVLAYWPVRTAGARTDGPQADQTQANEAQANEAQASRGPAAGRAVT
ncbi:MAG TPA: hypothetical protein VE464_22280 [Streptosporangiaceae bacterium]|nr:hypothetical protein [Streptosporangiaceae bacterium]